MIDPTNAVGDADKANAVEDSELEDEATIQRLTNADFEAEGDEEEIIDLPPNEFSPVQYDVTTRRIADIFSSYNDGELDTKPAFQRGYVWDRGRASRLIESVLLQVPLPLIYTAEDELGREVVIDGQQRLLTFIGFLSNRFPKDERPFRLSKLKILKDLSGKTFVELDNRYKVAFRRYGVSVIRISSQTNPNVKFEIFERLNTGAVSLSAQELRNCIYRGEFNDLLKELAKHPSFIRVLALKQSPERMIDSEMVLRFFAFSEKTHLNYPGKMKAFMNDFIRDNRHISVEKSAEWRVKFVNACDNVHSVFGDRAFRRYRIGSARDKNGGWENPINKALFDCIMFWFSRYERRQIVAHGDEIRDSLVDLMVNDREFYDSINLGTSDVARVKTRFEKVESALSRIVTTYRSERRLFSISEKKALFDADSTCGFCGQNIVTLDDAEVDHRIRFADGGPTTLANARLAHRYCNRANKSASGN